VEVGLQSIDPQAMTLMDRKNNLRAFERGVRAMMKEGIRVKVDLIIGLPGDTVASVRRGLHYLHDNGLCSDLQVFNLAVLPGTAFREEAAALGLVYQPRPPYYVLQTPTLGRTDLFGLMQEAQELFGIEFDAPPPPVLDFPEEDTIRVWWVDLDLLADVEPPPAGSRAQAFTLWLRAARLSERRRAIARFIYEVLEVNPFTSLQIVLEPTGPSTLEAVQRELEPLFLREVMSACQARPTYLDKYYALQPGRSHGAKRLILLLPFALRKEFLSCAWSDQVEPLATVAWRAGKERTPCQDEMGTNEFVWADLSGTDQGWSRGAAEFNASSGIAS
jgi:hypothetical protein